MMAISSPQVVVQQSESESLANAIRLLQQKKQLDVLAKEQAENSQAGLEKTYFEMYKNALFASGDPKVAMEANKPLFYKMLRGRGLDDGMIGEMYKSSMLMPDSQETLVNNLVSKMIKTGSYSPLDHNLNVSTVEKQRIEAGIVKPPEAPGPAAAVVAPPKASLFGAQGELTVPPELSTAPVEPPGGPPGGAVLPTMKYAPAGAGGISPSNIKLGATIQKGLLSKPPVSAPLTKPPTPPAAVQVKAIEAIKISVPLPEPFAPGVEDLTPKQAVTVNTAASNFSRAMGNYQKAVEKKKTLFSRRAAEGDTWNYFKKSGPGEAAALSAGYAAFSKLVEHLPPAAERWNKVISTPAGDQPAHLVYFANYAGWKGDVGSFMSSVSQGYQLMQNEVRQTTLAVEAQHLQAKALYQEKMPFYVNFGVGPDGKPSVFKPTLAQFEAISRVLMAGAGAGEGSPEEKAHYASLQLIQKEYADAYTAFAANYRATKKVVVETELGAAWQLAVKNSEHLSKKKATLDLYLSALLPLEDDKGKALTPKEALKTNVYSGEKLLLDIFRLPGGWGAVRTPVEQDIYGFTPSVKPPTSQGLSPQAQRIADELNK